MFYIFPGLLEKTYENALIVEFGIRGIGYQQQRRHEVVYKDSVVGEYVPDIIAYDCIVVEMKVIEAIGKHEMGQMINYLKVTGLRVGVIFNFRRPRLEWKRVVL